eukprot:jgi/Mesen1/3480/ME000195S02637
MAAIAALSSPTIARLSLEHLSSSASVSSRPTVSFAAPSRSLRLKGVRCQAQNDPLGQVKDAVSGTKVDVTEADVKKNEAENNSETKSVFGTKPVTASNSNGFYWLAIATNITIIASLIPIFQGESPDSRK